MGKGLKLFFKLLGLLALLTVISKVVLFYTNQQLLTIAFSLIPAFFLVASAMLAWLVNKINTKQGFGKIPVLLGFRIIVVFIGLFFLVIGMFLDRRHILPFAIVFVVYYIVFSIVETRVLMRLHVKKD